MAILAQCPICKRKQSIKNRSCRVCGEDLFKAKKSQRVIYFARVEIGNGKQHLRKVGPSLEKARAAEGKFKSKKEEGRIFEVLPDKKVTFNELALWYLGNNDKKKGPIHRPHPKIRDRATLGRMGDLIASFTKQFGNHYVSSVKTSHLEEHQDRLRSRGLAPRTIDYEFATVQTMLERARKAGKVSVEAVAEFRDLDKALKSGSNSRGRTLTLEEYHGLLSMAPAHLKVVLSIGFHTGMRSGEIRGVRRCHVDRSAKMIRLPASMTKENKPKSIPLNKYALEAIDRLPAALHHDYVFTYANKPMRGTRGFRRSLITACKKAGVPYGRDVINGMVFHDLRRTFKTNLARASVGKAYRDKILGHSPVGMDVHYIKLTDDDLHIAIAKFTEWYDTQAEKRDFSVTSKGNIATG